MHEKKAFSVVPKTSPRRPNHVTICLLRHPGESLQNGQLELRRRKLILCPRDPQGYSCISLSLPGRILKEYHGFCEIALTEVLATQMGVMRSKKVRSFELYKFNPLSPHCGSIAPELVHCLYLGSSANCYSSRQHCRPA